MPYTPGIYLQQCDEFSPQLSNKMKNEIWVLKTLCFLCVCVYEICRNCIKMINVYIF